MGLAVHAVLYMAVYRVFVASVRVAARCVGISRMALFNL